MYFGSVCSSWIDHWLFVQECQEIKETDILKSHLYVSEYSPNIVQYYHDTDNIKFTDN